MRAYKVIDGKKFKIKAKEVKASKPLNRHRAICYESSNPKVATVTKKGVIKGNRSGRAQSGFISYALPLV